MAKVTIRKNRAPQTGWFVNRSGTTCGMIIREDSLYTFHHALGCGESNRNLPLNVSTVSMANMRSLLEQGLIG